MLVFDVNFNIDQYLIENKDKIIDYYNRSKNIFSSNGSSLEEHELECLSLLCASLYCDTEPENLSLSDVKNCISNTTFNKINFEKFADYISVQIALWSLMEKGLVEEIEPGKYKARG